MNAATGALAWFILCVTAATTPACAPLRPDWCARATIQKPSNALWDRQFRGRVASTGLAVDEAGNVAFTGTFADWDDWGDGVREINDAGPKNDMFVAMLDAQGKTRWTRRFVGPNIQSGHDIAFDRDNNVIAVGETSGAADFGTGEIKGRANNPNAIAVKLDSSGRTLWAKLLAEASLSESVAIDASSNAYVAILTVDGLSVRKLDPEGKQLFDRRLGPSEKRARVVTDGKGNLVVVWRRPSDDGEQRIWIAKLDEAGRTVWSRALEEGDPRGVALDARGDILIVSDAGNEEESVGNAAKLTADGRSLWTRRLGPRMSPYDVAVDAHGNLLVTGIASGGLDVCGNHSPEPAQTAFLAKLDPAGSLVWAQPLAPGSWGGGEDVAVNAEGAIVVAGFGASGSLLFSLKPHAPSKPHLFVTRIGP